MIDSMILIVLQDEIETTRTGDGGTSLDAKSLLMKPSVFVLSGHESTNVSLGRLHMRFLKQSFWGTLVLPVGPFAPAWNFGDGFPGIESQGATPRLHPSKPVQDGLLSSE